MSRVQKLSRAVLVLSLVGVLSGYASAAKRSDNQRNRDEFSQSRMDARYDASMQNSADVQRASHILGKKVKSDDGRTLGTIYDIVLTPDLNSVSYVALSRGGAFGLGRDLYAVPWSAFRTGFRNTYYLPITESHLQVMNGFKEAYWPASPSGGWVAATGSAAAPAFRGTTREESREVQARRVSHIIGTTVRDAEGRHTGSIRDMVIAHDTGQIMYTIVSYGGMFGVGSRYAAVPPATIEVRPRGAARLNVDRDKLVATSFSPMRWPDLSAPSFEQRVAQSYGTQPSGAVLGYVPPESSAAVEPRTHVSTPAPAPQEAPAPAPEYQAPAATAPSYGTMSFNPSDVKTIEGTIIDTGRLGTAGAGMVGLRLKTADGEIVLVNLGPRDYISKQNFIMVDGDHVAITGADVTINGRPMFVATQVNRDGQILKLRDSSGHALWLQSSAADENTGVGTSVHSESFADVNHSADLDEE